MTIHVSPDGNDAWSGSQARPSGADGPVATLERARDLARGAAPDAAVRIVLHEGVYRRTEPLVLRPEDGGADGAPVVWEAAEGARPLISGLRPLAGEWQRAEAGVWKLALTGDMSRRFRQLFCDGRRLYRTRWPAEGYLSVYSFAGEGEMDHRRRFRFLQGDVRRWANLEDVEFVVIHNWSESRLFVESLDEENDIVEFTLGLYLDEFRTGVLMEKNVVHNTGGALLHLHNNYGHTIVNNIFARGGQAQLSWTRFHGTHFGRRVEKYRHPLHTFQRNIVYWREGCLSHNLDCNRWDLATEPELIDHNLYWKDGREDLEVPRLGRIPGDQVRFGLGHNARPGVGHDTLEDWQELGLDRHSVNEDPRFVDPENDDFRLTEDSPAFDLGFEPIDLSEVGPRGDGDALAGGSEKM
jgi:hypothetical protein